MKIIKETLKLNNLTHGILNKFIKIASEKECSDREFYDKMLFRVLNFREELIKKDKYIPELEEIFKRETNREIKPSVKRKSPKKVGKWVNLYIK